MMGRRNIQQTQIVFHCVLLTVLAGFAAGCAKEVRDPAQLRADETTLVRTTVTDPARAERLLAFFDERDRLVKETVALLQQYKREMKAINADFDTERDVVVEIIDYFNRERAQKQLRFIDLVTEMKRASSSEEWAIIADFEFKNFAPRQLIYQRFAGESEMLETMLTGFLLGGGLMGGLILNPAEVGTIADRVEQTIDDSVRVATATALLDELETEVGNYDKIFAESGEELSDIYRNHTAGSRPMLQTLEALNLEWYVSQNRSVKLRTQLKKSINAEEWARIFGDN